MVLTIDFFKQCLPGTHVMNICDVTEILHIVKVHDSQSWARIGHSIVLKMIVLRLTDEP